MDTDNGKTEAQDTTRMSISMTQEEYDLLKRAAEMDGGRSVSSFIRAHALPAAEQMLRRLEQHAEAI